MSDPNTYKSLASYSGIRGTREVSLECLPRTSDDYPTVPPDNRHKLKQTQKCFKCKLKQTNQTCVKAPCRV